jgi:hypothetical protein
MWQSKNYLPLAPESSEMYIFQKSDYEQKPIKYK